MGIADFSTARRSRSARNDGGFYEGAEERLLLEEKLSAKLTDEVLPQNSSGEMFWVFHLIRQKSEIFATFSSRRRLIGEEEAERMYPFPTAVE